MTLLVNFVFAPGLAYLLTTVVPLERAYAVGLLLFSIAAGAPFLPKLVEAANEDLPLSIAVMALLTAGTILFMPLAVPVLIPGFKADAWAIAKPLLVMMLLPLVIPLGPIAKFVVAPAFVGACAGLRITANALIDRRRPPRR